MLRRALLVSLLLLSAGVQAATGVHVTYLWHLEQPIYWPAPNASGQRYQSAWDSIVAKDAGAAHPENDLRTIFSKDDRVAAYQWRPHDAVQAILGTPDGGAQVSYSGGLLVNAGSLGEAGQLGYGASWAAGFSEARGWTTSGGHPRLDVVQFSFHHALLPLVDPEVARRELRLYREAYPETWGPAAPSRGLFPSEMAFAEHLIPILAEEDIDWVIVSNSHLSRACADYPWVAGSGGDNIPPPNRADVQNPAQGVWNRIQIDRGVAPANAVPFSYVPHRARYVDPGSGAVSEVIVVPAAQSESWRDGYECFGTGAVDDLAPHNDTGRPMLLLLAHDGDNAFGGGYSYYMECVPNFVSAAAAAGYAPSTVAQYLADHPVPTDDIVHVESGAWVNADGDFGAPSFWNWNWPLVDSQGHVDPAAGWAEDERNWTVITAATNIVLTATALAGEPDMALVLHPEDGAGDVERAWHYLLGSLNSGYMYYGKALDMELKPAVACNEAVAYAEGIIGAATEEPVPPTIWAPQRYPDNPGALNFGTLYGYENQVLGPAFLVWTFVHDVSGLQDVTLKVREDEDGDNPLDDHANETYAGGAGVGAWTSFPMTGREMPAGNVFDDPDIDVSILPSRLADVYHVEVAGYEDVLLDYYVEAVDTNGNVARSPILHVYVGSESGTNPDGVHWEPSRPHYDETVTVYAPAAGALHWGVDGWQAPPAEYQPAGTVAWDAQAVETPLEGPGADGFYSIVLGPFDGDASVTEINFVLHNADDTWDNNGGQDYLITIAQTPSTGPEPTLEPGSVVEPVDGKDAGSVIEPALEPVLEPVTPAFDAGSSGADLGTIDDTTASSNDLPGIAIPDAGEGDGDDGGGGGCSTGGHHRPWALLFLLLGLLLATGRAFEMRPRGVDVDRPKAG